VVLVDGWFYGVLRLLLGGRADGTRRVLLAGRSIAVLIGL
jgi:hypothetical protein